MGWMPHASDPAGRRRKASHAKLTGHFMTGLVLVLVLQRCEISLTVGSLSAGLPGACCIMFLKAMGRLKFLS